MEKFNFFKNFKNSMMGGHDEKLKNFGKSKKKSLIFTNQTIFFEKKISKLRWQMSFFERFFGNVKICFDRSPKSNAVFGS